MNRKGLTLVEVTIYIVLGTLVLTYALAAMKSVSKTYVHGREVTKMQQTGRDAINSIGRDLVNTGFKYYLFKDTNATTNKVEYEARPKKTDADSLFLKGTYLSDKVDPDYNTASPRRADSTASYFHTNFDPGDELELFRAKLVRTDLIGSIERVRYHQSNDTLFRTVQTSTTPTPDASGNIQWGPATTVGIVENVMGIQYQFSENGRDWVGDPTFDETKHLMKYIKVELLISSERDADIAPQSTNVVIGGNDNGVTFVPDGIHLYRTYTQTVPILNNGVVN